MVRAEAKAGLTRTDTARSSTSFEEASALLFDVRDIVAERPEGAAPPRWCVARGWEKFLADLAEDDVALVEREGLAQAAPRLDGAPPSLVALASAVRAVTALAEAPRSESAEVRAARRASPRKQAQVTRFADLVATLAPDARRVVDVGAGHGHLTRHLALALGVRAEGWDRDPARSAVATRLTGGIDVEFRTVDVGAGDVALAAGDVVVGLHACGALADDAVRAAGDAGVSIALIGCCLQKRDGARQPLSALSGRDAAAFALGRDVLGLANVRDGEHGVEDDLATRTRARFARIAVRALLCERGLDIPAGGEMRGVNRRRATGTLVDLAERAFATRGLPPPSAADVARVELEAAFAHARERRFSLPRAMLGRLIEVWVALDRAAFLGERGYDVELVRAFDEAVSPRNIALLARPARRS